MPDAGLHSPTHPTPLLHMMVTYPLFKRSAHSAGPVFVIGGYVLRFFHVDITRKATSIRELGMYIYTQKIQHN